MKLFPDLLIVLAVSILTGCSSCNPPSPAPDAAVDAGSALDAGSGDASTLGDAAKKSSLVVWNDTGTQTVVQVAFSSVSGVQSWNFCTSTGNLTCSFPLPGHSEKELPLGGNYLNATFAFGSPNVGCG